MIVSLACSAAFALGLYGVLTRRDLIAVLVSAELMVGAANVQLLVLALAQGARADVTSSLALVVLAVTAAEAAVGLALAVSAYRRSRRTQMDEFGEVSG